MSTRKKVPKKSRQSSTTLKQYYADDMNDEEIDYPKTGKIQKTVKATQDYDDDDDDLPSDNDYVNIEEPSTQDTIKKQSMDKISDILFSLILKNVPILRDPILFLIFHSELILRMLLIFLFLMLNN